MSWIINLTLNTDTQRFEKWLDRYHTRFFLEEYDLEAGKKLLIISAPTFNKEINGLRTHIIQAEVGEIDPSNSKRTILSAPLTVIEIELVEPAVGRINIKLICKHHKLVPHFLDLLKEIAKMWPETGEQVLSYIKEYEVDEDKGDETYMIDVSPLYHEKDFEPATIKDIFRFIIELNDDHSGMSRVIEQPAEVIRWIEFKPKEPGDNRLVFFAYENTEKIGQKLIRKALGEVIEYKCVSIGMKVKIKATCWNSENLLIAEHFEYLWRKFMDFLPNQVRQTMVFSIPEANDQYANNDTLRYGNSGKLIKPDMPKKKSSIYTWFDYYHSMKRAGFKMTFPMLADESGYSKNTFKEAHKRYKLERGIYIPKH